MRNEPDLLLCDFLLMGLENLILGEVPTCSEQKWSGVSQRGKGSVRVPVVHRTAFYRVGFPTRGHVKLFWAAEGLGTALWWPEERQGQPVRSSHL